MEGQGERPKKPFQRSFSGEHFCNYSEVKMKKAFDQTMRDLKRGVNKKVLKVPSIEQKVLDSTSNEPWGPHGSLLADIALATRNFNEYKIIMAVIWKRINDTGKNWRHVYKALTVLEYLVAHGSERVIDEIREHAYQINTLSDFQYIDSSGRDQGSNVRKKSQCLVVLVNDKERMQEVRQKASANRDKFRSVSMGSVHRPSSYSSTGGYSDGWYSGRYGSRDDNRIGYGKERGWSHRDEGIYGDSYGRHGDRYDREYEERNSHYAYTDSDYHGSGTSQSIDGYGSRSRSFDREGEIDCNGSGQQSSRGSGAEDPPQNERQQLERKFSEQNLAPLSLEEAAGAPTHTAGYWDVGTSPVTAESSSYLANASPSLDTGAPENNEAVELREFDPHVSLSAAHCASGTSAGPEVDLLGSLFEPLSSNSLALVPAGSLTGTSQDVKNPFGDEPFKAIPSSNGIPAQPPDSLPSSTQSHDVTQPTSHISDQDIDILADILPPPRLSQSEQPLPPCQIAPHLGFPPQATQQALHIRFVSQNGLIAQQGAGFPSQSGRATLMTSFAAQPGQQLLQTTLQTSHVDSQMWFPAQTNHQPQSLALVPSQAAPLTGFVGGYSNAPLCQFPHSMCIQAGETTHDNNSMHFSSHHGALAQAPSQIAALQSPRTPTETIPPFAIQPLTQPAKEKFETKSTIWTDTLNRGLVNLNISGPKTNPLADIGVDFDAMNRKEKRMASPSNSTAPSVTMGKAMGCGSGIGRAGAGALRPLQTQMVSAHPAAAAAGVPLGGYRGLINQTMGMGMMRPLQPQQQIQQPNNNTGFPPGTNVTGGQYPLPGTANYGHLPFGGGYRR